MYDLAVVGGGTAGCAAAYIAGKLGLKVILIEKNIHLGGAITSGLVVPAMQSGNNQINKGFFEDLISELKIIGGQVTYQDNPGWLNPELTKIILDMMMRKSSVDIRFCSKVEKIIANKGHIQKIYINKFLSEYNDQIQQSNKILLEPIEAKYVIDATGNCEIFKILNCDFQNDSNNFQPVSLRFIMGGIDLNTFSKWLMDYDKDRNVTTCECIDGTIHLSTAYTWDSDKHWALSPLFDDAVDKNILKDTDRNYFQIFTIAGMPDSVAFNCPRIVDNVDPNKVIDITSAVISAREAILRLADFCKIYFPGFEKAYISNIADQVGIRVSNRIKGKYTYTEKDIINCKKFENPVLISNYPIDVHSKDKNTSTLLQTGEYQLPIEALMSKDYDNLFVAGRGLSADYKAQGALRIQASCFSMGEAIAKYIVKNN